MKDSIPTSGASFLDPSCGGESGQWGIRQSLIIRDKARLRIPPQVEVVDPERPAEQPQEVGGEPRGHGPRRPVGGGKGLWGT